MLAKTLITDSLKLLGVYFKDPVISSYSASVIIDGALAKLGIVNPTTSNRDSALPVLNDMLAEWDYDGISFPYTPATSTSTVMGVPTYALSAIRSMLAVRVSPQYGKEPNGGLVAEAQQSYEQLAKKSQSTNLATGLRSLNDMMLEWDYIGISIGYLNPQAITDETGIPDWAIGAVKYSLAVRMAPAVGVPASAELAAVAMSSYSRLLAMRAQTIEVMRAPGTPVGAGNRRGIYGNKHYHDNTSSDLIINLSTLNNSEGDIVGNQ